MKVIIYWCTSDEQDNHQIDWVAGLQVAVLIRIRDAQSKASVENKASLSKVLFICDGARWQATHATATIVHRKIQSRIIIEPINDERDDECGCR